MRRFLFLLAVAFCVPAPAAAGTLFVIDGRGWGHGVGMSQYGAQGFAQAGWGYERILKHFYRGTQVRAVAPRSVRVLLAERVSAAKISSKKPFKVVDARGKARTLKPGRQNLVAGKLGKLRLPLRYEPGAAPLQLDGDAYRGASSTASKLRSSIGSRSTATCAASCRGDARSLAPEACAAGGGRAPMPRRQPGTASTSIRTPGARCTAVSGPRRTRRTARSAPPRPRRPVGRPRRHHLLPLDLRWRDRAQRTWRAGPQAAALPGLRARSVRRRLEASRLGAVRADPGRGGAGGAAPSA